MANEQAWKDYYQFEDYRKKIIQKISDLREQLFELESFKSAIVDDVEVVDTESTDYGKKIPNLRKAELAKLLKEHPELTVTKIQQLVSGYRSLQEFLNLNY